jgi:hypothetical protein
LHHVPRGVVGERSIQGGDEAVGIEVAGRHYARSEPLLESAGLKLARKSFRATVPYPRNKLRLVRW